MLPFHERLLTWFDQHGRHDLPWQHPREPYRVWLAEIMLQQTQVTTVIPYFQRFLQRFPTLQSLADAPQDDVLALWAGLGYYARARNLHACAKEIQSRHAGVFPRTLEECLALPGIGRSTAGAVLSQAYGQRHPILDGNVRRVLARHAAIVGWPGQPATLKRLWALSESLLPQGRMADYTQAIMDLGATLCTTRKPACELCPVRQDCQAHQQGRFAEFPAAKPRRARGDRQAHLLLLENPEAGFLMERRPPTGIWGGLWCPPLLNETQDWQSYLQRHYPAAALSDPEVLPPVHHAFTHFDLSIHPLRFHVAQTPMIQDAAQWRWIKIDAQVGLPAPVQKLLQSPHIKNRTPCPEPFTASS